MKLLRLSLTLAATVLAHGAAFAIDLLPRAGVQVGHYSVENLGTQELVTAGPTLGLTLAIGNAVADLSAEALPVDIAGTPSQGWIRGWRSELTVTGGYQVLDGVVLIGGYRTSRYGERFGSSQMGDNSGPFVGVNFPELRLGSSNRDILSLAVAIQATTYTDRVRGVEQDSDVGVNIRLGYRRAGSPHAFGVRYQSFGSPSYQEYLTTLQYAYVFGRF
jgi:hypothetical protein